jgi:Protein of unknown function (DUF3151)
MVPAPTASAFRRGSRSAYDPDVTDSHVELRASPPDETVLDPEAIEAAIALHDALAAEPSEQRDAISSVVARWPMYLEAWAELGERGRDAIEAYACYRVAYHRGLDRLRKAGWRGSGYVRWAHPENRGFLRALDGLRRVAGEIGETDEADRCGQLLLQLEPRWGEVSTES